MSDAEKKQQLAARIQRQMLRETRQRLREAQEELKTKEAEVEALRKKQEEKDEDTAAIKTLAAEEVDRIKAMTAATIERQRAIIDMLKQRVENINDEYNAAYGNRAIQAPRRATTLADVHKLTGEIDND
ncbi:MAG: hypothetical protein ACXABY_01835 [Candidatus Thorarchaeota archaeon]|jgi:hypothetical protein